MPALAFKSEAEWLSIRELHVGGSEVASLFYTWQSPSGEARVLHLFEDPPEGFTLVGCCSPFKTGYRLWMEKSGQVEPDPLDENERVQAGLFLEPALAAWAKQRWSWAAMRKVRRYLTHPEVPGWGSSLDYEINEPGRPPVEFKNVDGGSFCRNWICDGQDITGLPLNYALQVQAQIGVAEASHGWIVACVGGNQLRRGRIERHEPTQEKITGAVSAFWQAIRDGKTPTAVADYEAVAELHRYGDKGLPEVDLSQDTEFDRLCNRYRRLKVHADKVEVAISNVKGRLAARLGDATRAVSGGFKVTWPAITRPAKQIPARWQEELTYRGALLITPTKED
jgi:predicted phage-related endonuclease